MTTLEMGYGDGGIVFVAGEGGYPVSCRICYGSHPGVSCYWNNQGKTPADKRPGRTFERSDGNLGCGECCNGDRCDDPSHFDRMSCPYCLGSGTNATTKTADSTVSQHSEIRRENK